MAAAANVENIPNEDEVERMLAENLEAGVIDEEEWFLLTNMLHDIEHPPPRGRNINIPHLNYPAFNFDSWSEDECWVDLRFHKADIPRLAQAS